MNASTNIILNASTVIGLCNAKWKKMNSDATLCLNCQRKKGVQLAEELFQELSILISNLSTANIQKSMITHIEQI